MKKLCSCLLYLMAFSVSAASLGAELLLSVTSDVAAISNGDYVSPDLTIGSPLSIEIVFDPEWPPVGHGFMNFRTYRLEPALNTTIATLGGRSLIAHGGETPIAMVTNGASDRFTIDYPLQESSAFLAPISEPTLSLTFTDDSGHAFDDTELPHTLDWQAFNDIELHIRGHYVPGSRGGTPFSSSISARVTSATIRQVPEPPAAALLVTGLLFGARRIV